MENIIYGKNAIIEALENSDREFNKILIANSAHADVKIEKIKAARINTATLSRFVRVQFVRNP